MVPKRVILYIRIIYTYLKIYKYKEDHKIYFKHLVKGTSSQLVGHNPKM